MIQQRFRDSGEAGPLSVLKGLAISTIFDVGCNRGDWTLLARDCFPDTMIHTFELCPLNYQEFLNRNCLDHAITPNGFGLGDVSGFVDYKYCFEDTTLCTQLIKVNPGTRPDVSFEWRKGLLVRGDEYVASRRVGPIDILKIDTEGGEPAVLRGLGDVLVRAPVGLIQFEYGLANILNRFLLLDYYELLAPLGYQIGLLGPCGITFRNYSLLHEDFQGPNFVAVHYSRMDILERIQNHFTL